MDYSKLSDDELIALKKGDYSKLSDETLMALKGEATPPQAPSMMDKVKGVWNKAQEINQNPLIKYGANLPQTMSNIGTDLVNRTGDKVSDTMAEHGVDPNLAAATNYGIRLAPIAAGVLAGVPAAAEDMGQFGKVISGPARAEAGQAMGNLERGVGLETDVVPSLKQMSAKLGLKQASTKDYITAVMKAAKNGELSPQDLLEHHKLITALMENEPGKIAQMLQGKPSPLGGTGGKAIASKADSLIVQQLNEAVPGRADQAANYAAAMTRNKMYQRAGYAAGAGISSLIGPKLADLLKKTWGH